MADFHSEGHIYPEMTNIGNNWSLEYLLLFTFITMIPVVMPLYK